MGILTHEVTNNQFDIRFAQGACFLVGLLVLVLSFWKLTRLELTEAQLFFGVLLSLCVPLLFIAVGLLLPLAVRPEKSNL